MFHVVTEVFGLFYVCVICFSLSFHNYHILVYWVGTIFSVDYETYRLLFLGTKPAGRQHIPGSV